MDGRNAFPSSIPSAGPTRVPHTETGVSFSFDFPVGRAWYQSLRGGTVDTIVYASQDEYLTIFVRTPAHSSPEVEYGVVWVRRNGQQKTYARDEHGLECCSVGWMVRERNLSGLCPADAAAIVDHLSRRLNHRRKLTLNGQIAITYTLGGRRPWSVANAYRLSRLAEEIKGNG